MLLDLYGQVDSAVNTIADLGQQLSEYREVESAGLLLTETEKRAARLTNLKDLSTELLTYTQRIDAAREYLDTVKDLDVAASNMQYVERTTEKLEALKTLRGAYTTADTERKRLTEDLEALKGTQEAAELFRVVDDKLVRLNSLKALSDEVQSKTGLAESYKDDVRKAGEAYLAAENELAAAWEAAGGTCPLCNQPVSSDHAH
jgi:exonuclease SbcC